MTLEPGTLPESSGRSFGRRILFNDSIRYLPSILGTALAGILVLPVVTRLLSASSFGNYSLVMAFAIFLQVITTTWLSSTIIRFYAGASQVGDTSSLVASAFFITLAFSAGTATLTIIGLLLVKGHMARELVLLAAFIPAITVPFNMMTLPLQVLRMERRIGLHNWLNIGRLLLPPAGGAVAVLFAARGEGTWMAGWSAALWILFPLSYLATFRGGRWPWQGGWSRAWGEKLLRYGVPLIPALMLVKILEVSDRFIIGFYRTEIDVALYSAAYAVASMPMELIILAVGSAAAPLLNTIWEQRGRADTEAFLETTTRGFLIISIPAVVGLSLLKGPILSVFAPAQYGSATGVIPIVAAGSLLLGLQWLAQRGMLLAQETTRILGCYGVAGAVNVVANIILVPRFGYPAAAWTTLGAYAVLLVMVAHESKKFLAWRLPWPTVIRTLVASGAMAIPIFAIPELPVSDLLHLVIRSASGAAVYGLCILALGELGPIWKIVKRAGAAAASLPR